MSTAIATYIIICFLLIIFSLFQQNQSGGLGVLGGSSGTVLGSDSVSFLSKLVTFLAILFFVGSFFLNVISSSDKPVIILDEDFEDTATEEVLTEDAPVNDTQTDTSTSSPLDSDANNPDLNPSATSPSDTQTPDSPPSSETPN